MLDGVAASLDVVAAAAGKDAADHLAAGHGIGDFKPLAVATPLATQPVDGASPLAYVSLETVRMRSIVWLERPLWQLSAFHLLAGVKGAGKGTYLARLTAKITGGGLSQGGPRTVVFVSSEDSLEVDLKPRLVAAGADLTRCKFITEAFRLPDDLERLAATLIQIGDVAAAVIDPVSNHTLAHVTPTVRQGSAMRSPG